MVSSIAALEFEDFYLGILKPKASYLAIAEHHSKASLKQFVFIRTSEADEKGEFKSFYHLSLEIHGSIDDGSLNILKIMDTSRVNDQYCSGNNPIEGLQGWGGIETYAPEGKQCGWAWVLMVRPEKWEDDQTFEAYIKDLCNPKAEYAVILANVFYLPIDNQTNSEEKKGNALTHRLHLAMGLSHFAGFGLYSSEDPNDWEYFGFPKAVKFIDVNSVI